MAATQRGTAQEIGQVLAEAVCDLPGAVGVWYEELDDEVFLWVLTEPKRDADAEFRFYQRGMEIYRRFPDQHISFSVINPADYTSDAVLIGEEIPTTAIRVTLR